MKFKLFNKGFTRRIVTEIFGEDFGGSGALRPPYDKNAIWAPVFYSGS